MKYAASVDMISFISKMSDEVFYKYNSYLQLDPRCKMWVGTMYKQYRYNYTVESGTSSYYIGFQHNTEKYEGGLHGLKIEYNPNKIEIDNVLKDLLKYCLFNHDTKLKSVDVAFDLHVPFQNYIIDRGSRHRIDVYKGTLYIGERSNGVKIYDKQKESGLAEPLTRYEVRIPFDCLLHMFMFVQSAEFDNLPTITFIDTLPLDVYERVTILGLMQDISALSNFKRGRREKYKKYLKQLTNFSPPSNEIIQCIKSYINQLKFQI